MNEFDDGFMRQSMDMDLAVMQALERVDKGLFDRDESVDEDLKALYEN